MKSFKAVSLIALVVSICIVILFVLGNNIYLSWNCRARQNDQLLLVYSDLQNNEGYHLIDLRGCRTYISKGLLGDEVLNSAAWSPTGDHVAILHPVAPASIGSTNEDHQWFIQDINITTMMIQKYRLLKGGYANSLVWSADNAYLLFRWGIYPKPTELWQLDLITGQASLLSQLPKRVDKVSWSPDHSQVAFNFNGDQSNCDKLYLQNTDGTSRRVIYEDECIESEIVWSPDGKAIAFTIWPNLSEPNQLCWMYIAGLKAVCSQQYIGTLAWSPDSKYIAFSTQDRIDMLDIQAKTTIPLLNFSSESAHYLSWSPNGKYLAYGICVSSEAPQTCKVHILRIADRKHWQLTSSWGADDSPIWSPAIPTPK